MTGAERAASHTSQINRAHVGNAMGICGKFWTFPCNRPTREISHDSLENRRPGGWLPGLAG